MSLTNDDVKKVAHLARLEVSDDKLAAYGDNLNKILHLVEEMNKADTDKIEPMAHAMGEADEVVQRMRTDAVTETNQRDQFQAIAPAVEAGLYLVPQVIE